MQMEILQGRGCGKKGDHIHLHINHIDPEIIKARLPGILETAMIF